MKSSGIPRLRADLAELIAMWIASEGLLQREAGKKLDLRQQHVSRIVAGQGQRVALETLITAFERIGGKVHLKIDWPYTRKLPRAAGQDDEFAAFQRLAE